MLMAAEWWWRVNDQEFKQVSARAMARARAAQAREAAHSPLPPRRRTSSAKGQLSEGGLRRAYQMGPSDHLGLEIGDLDCSSPVNQIKSCYFHRTEIKVCKTCNLLLLLVIAD